MADVLDIGSKSCFVFGHSPEFSDFILQHNSISRKHAALVHDAEGILHVIDLGSKHGTYVDDEKLKPHEPMMLRGMNPFSPFLCFSVVCNHEGS